MLSQIFFKLKKNLNKYSKNIFYFLFILWIAIIFSFSLRPGNISHKQSTTVKSELTAITDHHAANISLYLKDIFNNIYKNKEKINSNGVVRKLAHITEYFILGLISASIINLLFLQRKKYWLIFILVGPIIALIDEKIIQKYLTVGRTSSFTDVAIDCFGFYAALVVFLIIDLVIKFIRKYIAKVVDLRNQ